MGLASRLHIEVQTVPGGQSSKCITQQYCVTQHCSTRGSRLKAVSHQQPAHMRHHSKPQQPQLQPNPLDNPPTCTGRGGKGQQEVDDRPCGMCAHLVCNSYSCFSAAVHTAAGDTAHKTLP
jgi:hypothetical protein